MPASQRGSVVKRGKRWAARWYDDSDTRRFQGGFDTRTAAREFVDSKVEEVAALRRGDPSAIRRQEMPTFDELADEYVAQHAGEANTIKSLRGWLQPSRRKWGPLRVDRIVASEIALWRRTLPERASAIMTVFVSCRRLSC